MTQLKFYLDTNMSERFFKNAIFSKRRKTKLEIPKIFGYLVSINAELYVSSFSLAEVYEHMWKSYQAQPHEISEMTQLFLQKFKIKLILDFEISGKILHYVRKRKLEAKDAVHLSIAKNNDIYLLSDDNDFIERARAFYAKLIAEKSLRTFFIRLHSLDNFS